MDRRLRIFLLALPIVLLHALAYWASAPRSEGRLHWPAQVLAQENMNVGVDRFHPQLRQPPGPHSPHVTGF